jgi:hypothetical protein
MPVTCDMTSTPSRSFHSRFLKLRAYHPILITWTASIGKQGPTSFVCQLAENYIYIYSVHNSQLCKIDLEWS